MKRIEKYYPIYPITDVKSRDFTMFGLRKKSKWVKGRKTQTEYLDPETMELVVKKTFSDVVENDVLIGIKILFEWFDDKNEVFENKDETVYLDILEAGELERKRRQRAIDKLVLSTRAFPQIAYVLDTIFSHYKAEIEKFIATGSDAFEKAMDNETDAQIKGMLEAIANPENNFTVKDSILYEI